MGNTKHTHLIACIVQLYELQVWLHGHMANGLGASRAKVDANGTSCLLCKQGFTVSAQKSLSMIVADHHPAHAQSPLVQHPRSQ